MNNEIDKAKQVRDDAEALLMYPLTKDQLQEVCKIIIRTGRVIND